MKVFTRDDGRTLRMIPGFRDRVLSAPRVSVQPKPTWSGKDYQAAADKKWRHSQQLLAEFSRWGGALDGARVLEVGCGAGLDCLLLALHLVREVVGIDVHLPLFDAN